MNNTIYGLRNLRATLSGQLTEVVSQHSALSIKLSDCVNADKASDCDALRRSLSAVNRVIASLQREIARVDHSIKIASHKARGEGGNV